MCSQGLRIPFIALIVLFSIATEASLPNCFVHFARISRGENIEWVDDKVAIVYFPTEWHAKVEVDGHVYSTFVEHVKRNSRTARAVEELARTGGPSAVRFSFRVTKEEFAKLQEYVAARHSFNPRTCMGRACDVITRNTAVTIPFPVSQFPLYGSLYLALRKATGTDFGRIQNIRIVGSVPKSLVGAAGAAVGEAFYAGMVVLLVYEMVDAFGKIHQHQVEIQAK